MGVGVAAPRRAGAGGGRVMRALPAPPQPPKAGRTHHAPPRLPPHGPRPCRPLLDFSFFPPVHLSPFHSSPQSPLHLSTCPARAAVGDARVGLVGFPSVGKSTLLTKVTGTFSEAAGYGMGWYHTWYHVRYRLPAHALHAARTPACARLWRAPGCLLARRRPACLPARAMAARAPPSLPPAAPSPSRHGAVSWRACSALLPCRRVHHSDLHPWDDQVCVCVCAYMCACVSVCVWRLWQAVLAAFESVSSSARRLPRAAFHIPQQHIEPRLPASGARSCLSPPRWPDVVPHPAMAPQVPRRQDPAAGPARHH